MPFDDDDQSLMKIKEKEDEMKRQKYIHSYSLLDSIKINSHLNEKLEGKERASRSSKTFICEIL